MIRLVLPLVLPLLGCTSSMKEDPQPVDYYNDLVTFRTILHDTVIDEWLLTASPEEIEQHNKVHAIVDAADEAFRVYLTDSSEDNRVAILSALDKALEAAHELTGSLTGDEDKARWARAIVSLCRGIVLSMQAELSMPQEMVEKAESLPVE